MNWRIRVRLLPGNFCYGRVAYTHMLLLGITLEMWLASNDTGEVHEPHFPFLICHTGKGNKIIKEKTARFRCDIRYGASFKGYACVTTTWSRALQTSKNISYRRHTPWHKTIYFFFTYSGMLTKGEKNDKKSTIRHYLWARRQKFILNVSLYLITWLTR